MSHSDTCVDCGLLRRKPRGSPRRLSRTPAKAILLLIPDCGLDCSSFCYYDTMPGDGWDRPDAGPGTSHCVFHRMLSSKGSSTRSKLYIDSGTVYHRTNSEPAPQPAVAHSLPRPSERQGPGRLRLVPEMFPRDGAQARNAQVGGSGGLKVRGWGPLKREMA